MNPTDLLSKQPNVFTLLMLETFRSEDRQDTADPLHIQRSNLILGPLTPKDPKTKLEKFNRY